MQQGLGTRVLTDKPVNELVLSVYQSIKTIMSQIVNLNTWGSSQGDKLNVSSSSIPCHQDYHYCAHGEILTWKQVYQGGSKSTCLLSFAIIKALVLIGSFPITSSVITNVKC